MKRIALVVCIFAISGCASSGGKKTDPDARAALLLDAALAAYQDNDPPASLRYLVEAEKLKPDYPELFHLRGLALWKTRRRDEALASFRKAIAQRETYSDARNTLGRCLMEMGRTAEAVTELKKAGDDPLYADAYKPNTALGIHFYRAGRSEQARARLQLAADSSPLKACHAHYYLGHLAIRKGALSSALEHYERATRKICAGFVDAHLAIGIVRERSGDTESARKKFLEIAKNYPKTPVASKALNHLRALP